MKRPLSVASFLLVLAPAACHRDDPPRALPQEHVVGQQTAADAPDDLSCLSHGKATTFADYQAIAKRITRRIADLRKHFPALDGLELDDLHVSNERPDALDVSLHFSHDVSWEKPQPQGAGPGKLGGMTPSYEGAEAVDLQIYFFTGPDMGRLMVPLVAIGAMNAKLVVLAPDAEELTRAIRAILLDEARRFAACT